MNWRFLRRAPSDEGVLAPHPALVFARNALAWAAVATGAFAVLMRGISFLYLSPYHVQLFRKIPDQSHNLSVWLLSAVALLTLLMRDHAVKGALIVVTGTAASMIGIAASATWLDGITWSVLLLYSASVALAAYSALLFAELLLLRQRDSRWHGVHRLLLSFLLVLLLRAFEVLQLGSWFIPYWIATAAFLLATTPLLIDKRRVPLPPDRGVTLLWIALNLSALHGHLHWQSHVVAVGNCLVTAVLVYLAWRNSRPQSSAPASTVPV